MFDLALFACLPLLASAVPKNNRKPMKEKRPTSKWRGAEAIGRKKESLELIMVNIFPSSAPVRFAQPVEHTSRHQTANVETGRTNIPKPNIIPRARRTGAPGQGTGGYESNRGHSVFSSFAPLGHDRKMGKRTYPYVRTSMM